MQQGSNANVQEQFGLAVEEVQNLLAEHERWCTEQVAAAEEGAQTGIVRFEEASEQPTQEWRKLADLEEERERLPFEAFRANMDGNSELESELRKRHREIKPEVLERLRDRCEALAAEADSLGGTARGAEKRAHGNARDTYASVLRFLEAFEDRIDLLKAALGGNRSKLWIGQRRVEEHLQFLRKLERDERREARSAGPPAGRKS